MTMTIATRTTLVRVLRRAARLMERGKEANGQDPRFSGCCYAIDIAASGRDERFVFEAMRIMRTIFEIRHRRTFWFGKPGTNISVRILALLFCAEFIGSGDADDL